VFIILGAAINRWVAVLGGRQTSVLQPSES